MTRIVTACALMASLLGTALNESVIAADQASGAGRGGVQPPPARGGQPPATPPGVSTPPGYTIGPDDSLSIVFWREKDMSADVVVRPDGMISLPLVNEVKAEGLTPEQLRAAITAAALKFVEDPTVTVVVKDVNSRKVFITGQVGKPGPYQLSGPMTVLQLISTAGGVAEFSDKEHIVVIRTEGGKSVSLPFNYKEVAAGRRLQQNIELKPGDSIVVP